MISKWYCRRPRPLHTDHSDHTVVAVLAAGRSIQEVDHSVPAASNPAANCFPGPTESWGWIEKLGRVRSLPARFPFSHFPDPAEGSAPSGLGLAVPRESFRPWRSFVLGRR